MPQRFNPLTALDASFLGVPFKVARERGEGGRRGPLHEYPDRDEPFFEDLGRRARRFELEAYFIGSTADLQATLFVSLLWQGKVGSLILPGLRRERVKAVSWAYDKDAARANWVACHLTFVEAGRNQYPAPSTSWSHTLIKAVDDALTAITDALGKALDTIGLTQEVLEDLVFGATALSTAMGVGASLGAGNLPSTALASAALLTGGYLTGLGPALGALSFAAATTVLIVTWAQTLAGDSPNRAARMAVIEALWTVYASVPYGDALDPELLTATDEIIVANRGALEAAIRRVALAEIARQAAALQFASYDDAAALRSRMADAFDVEIGVAGNPLAPGGRDDGARAALQDLRSTTLQAISAAGADKARLVPYVVARPRPALALAQLFYGDSDDVPSRAAELVARTGAVHPAFLPARGERLSK